LYSLPTTVKVIKSRKMCWVGHGALMMQTRNEPKYPSGKLGDQGLNRKMVFHADIKQHVNYILV
jgi:hypothetical protein